ncbi:MAG: keto-deoxy-phosphogluconate aldolase [Marmoricola sp.]|nr:keto-deoxy-phosphogluconate aldolase [Marmoricola sp.]
MTELDAVNEQRLGQHRVIPVVVAEDVAFAEPLRQALMAGGLPLAEVTLRSPAAIETLRILADDPEMLVGVGTVIHPSQIAGAINAGARFVVTPGFAPSVVRECQMLGISVFPGVATATEVQMALDVGLNILKFFPAALTGGPAAINALAEPYGDVRFIPTGGITADTLCDYARLAPVLAVGGSWLASRDLLRTRRFDEITRLASEAIALAGGLSLRSSPVDKEA